ncbi:MAG: hypothetical protein NUV55_06190, partial [Sulfuricaulis sp.]|uniref:hypothetical protein n=1 Tax=Sulfuricaulis sp. TaxID=2003553 RepID=UPI0025EF3B29
VLSIGVVVITLTVAIGLIRWFAPQLLGIPVDLQSVRVSKEVPRSSKMCFGRKILKASLII